MKYIVFSVLASLGFAGLLFVGCGDGFAGSHVFIPSCQSDPYAYEACLEDCFETVAPYCEEFCEKDPTLPWCDPGTGGTGGDGGTGGIGGTGGVGGTGGTGGTIPECYCDWQCLDGNHCTYDQCVDGVCTHSPRPKNVFCRVDGEYGYCDGEGNCDPICECGNGHCKDREHRHQRGHGHCESHCDDDSDSDHCHD